MYKHTLLLLLALALTAGCIPIGPAPNTAPTVDIIATSVAATLQAAVPPASPTAPIPLPSTGSQPTPASQAPAPQPTSPPPTNPPVSAPTSTPSRTQGGVQPPPPTPAAVLRGPYAVIQVARNDTLNMRQGPGINYRVVDRLAPDATNVQLTGRSEIVDGRRWVEAVRPNGNGTAWVNSVYLTEYVSPQAFCADQRVPQLLDQVAQAFIQKDGKQLASLVSPLHGLDVTYLRTGRTASYTQEEARWMFESTYQANWGTHPASGLEVKGSFHEKVLPDLLDVLDNPHQAICNNPAMGGSSYTFQWPARYRNINFYSLYKPGPAGQELAWRTWLAGVEYINGKPYLFALMHLFWEP